MTENSSEITDAVLAIAAIGGIMYLATRGVTDFEILGMVAGLGGYRMYRNGGK